MVRIIKLRLIIRENSKYNATISGPDVAHFPLSRNAFLPLADVWSLASLAPHRQTVETNVMECCVGRFYCILGLLMLQKKLSSFNRWQQVFFAESLVSSIQINCFLKRAPDSLQKAPSNLPEHVTDWKDDFRQKKLTLAM